MTRSQLLRGFVSQSGTVKSDWANIIGTNTSGSDPVRVPRKAAGATPTTVTGWPLIRTVRPTTAGSALKRRVQYWWLNTATTPRGPPLPGMRSSAAAMGEPRAMFTPRTSK